MSASDIGGILPDRLADVALIIRSNFSSLNSVKPQLDNFSLLNLFIKLSALAS